MLPPHSAGLLSRRLRRSIVLFHAWRCINLAAVPCSALMRRACFRLIFTIFCRGQHGRASSCGIVATRFSMSALTIPYGLPSLREAIIILFYIWNTFASAHFMRRFSYNIYSCIHHWESKAIPSKYKEGVGERHTLHIIGLFYIR